MKKFILTVLIAAAVLIVGCAKDTLQVPTEPIETVTPRPTFSHTITPTFTHGAESPTVTLTITPELSATPTATTTATATVTPAQPAVTVEIKCAGEPSACTAKDTMIISAAPTTNYGAFSAMNVGAYDASHKRRSMFYFDLSSIPSGAVIEDARFIFNIETFLPQGSSFGFSAYVLTAAWVESEETWETNSGGSYSGLLGSANVISTGSWTLFLSAAVVQQWVGGTLPNHGFILISGTESTATAEDIIIIGSKESASESVRPYLRIVYRLP